MFKDLNKKKIIALIVAILFIINVIVLVKLLFFTEEIKTYTKDEYTYIMRNKEEL